jgi:hypothetical protein
MATIIVAKNVNQLNLHSSIIYLQLENDHYDVDGYMHACTVKTQPGFHTEGILPLSHLLMK